MQELNVNVDIQLNGIEICSHCGRESIVSRLIVISHSIVFIDSMELFPRDRNTLHFQITAVLIFSHIPKRLAKTSI